MSPINSYFSWGRRSGPRASTPSSLEDASHARSLSSAPTTPSTGGRQKTSQRLLRSRPSENVINASATPRRGPDEVHECFSIENNLRKTRHRLDACAFQIDIMQISAINIRQDLESLQRALASMGERATTTEELPAARVPASRSLEEVEDQETLSSSPTSVAEYITTTQTVPIPTSENKASAPEPEPQPSSSDHQP